MIDPRANIHYQRLIASDESKKTLYQKIRAIRALTEIHEDKILEQEDWRSTYRLPELFGISERKKSELFEHLPEVLVESEFDQEYNHAIAAKSSLDYFRSQAKDDDVLLQVLGSAVDFGTGIKYDGIAHVERPITPIDFDADPVLFLQKGKEEKRTVYYGLGPSMIDVRDAFPDPAAIIDHDPSGVKGMGYFYRRIIMTYGKFRESFDGKTGFSIDKVQAVDWGSVEMMGLERTDTKHEGEEKAATAFMSSYRAPKDKNSKNYVVVFEGWDDQDGHFFLANGQLIYEGANPFAHKQIPVTFYYNYKRDDSIWGISEGEINAPFILVKELLVNLMIDNAKLSQQPVVAVSGDVQFDPDENELEPGALFTLSGLNGGKISDSITPLTFGSSVEPAMAVKQIVEDLQIQVTGDDSRALMVNPNELATQTLKKSEALQKRIRKNILQNSIHSQTISITQQFSNIAQYLARPYQDINGKWKQHTVFVDDFKISQRTKTSLPKFTPVSGYLGCYQLNEKMLNTDKVRFKFIERVQDAVKKEQEMQSLQLWMQNIMNLAQAAPQLLANTDMELLAKQTGARFSGIDVEAIFNSASRIVDGMDEMDYHIQQIALGIKPVVPVDGNNLRRFGAFRKFMDTKEFKTLSDGSKRIFQETLLDIAEKIRTEKAAPYSEFIKLRTMGGTSSTGQQGTVPGSAGPSGTPLQPTPGQTDQGAQPAGTGQA